MRNILEVLENELEMRKLRAHEWYDKYQKLYEDYHDLKKENEILRNDLKELSDLWQKEKQKV